MIPWTPAASALSAAPGAASLTTFAEFVVDGSTFHQFAHVDGTDAGVHHATSEDGELWAWDASRILGPGSETWENLTVGVPCVWVEGGTWYMLYRGTGSDATPIGIGLATASAAGGPWTRAQAAPVFAGDVEVGPGRVIKVGATYYAHASSFANRRVLVLTSTDLLSWSVAVDNVWTGGRFCNCIWREGGMYYSLVPHYRDGAACPSDIELYVSTSPLFPASDRTFVGTVLPAGDPGSWSAGCLDTPTVICTDVTKTAYPAATGGRPWVYYAGRSAGGAWRSGLIKDVDIHGDAPSWAVNDYPAGWFTAANRAVYANGDVLAVAGAAYAVKRQEHVTTPPATGLL